MNGEKLKVYLSCTKKDPKKRAKILSRAMMIRSFQERYEFVPKLDTADLVLMIDDHEAKEEGMIADREAAGKLGILLLDVDEHFHDKNDYTMQSLLDDTVKRPELEKTCNELVRALLDDTLDYRNHELERDYGFEH